MLKDSVYNYKTRTTNAGFIITIANFEALKP